MTDEQKIIILMLLETEKCGHDIAWITKDELATGKCTPKNTPEIVIIQLLWAALTMPKGILEWSQNNQAFRLQR